MNQKAFSIIGGDERCVYVANYLHAKGYSVTVFGFDQKADFSPGIREAETLAEALRLSDYILLPIPFSTDKSTLFMPFSKTPVTVQEFCSLLIPGQTVFAGKLDPETSGLLQNKRVTIFDYGNREEFAVSNAISTAEAAIEIGMRELPVTLNGTECLVIGFGRISKILCRYLSGLGARVTASARKHSDFSWMQAFGHKIIHTKDISSKIGKFRLIYNTVPHLLLDRTVLEKVSKNSIIIDLASKPGGTDFSAAQNLGIPAIHALSLPGKASPETAGKVICETILNILSEEEVKL